MCSNVDITMTEVLFWLFIHQIYDIEIELNFLQYSVINIFPKAFLFVLIPLRMAATYILLQLQCWTYDSLVKQEIVYILWGLTYWNLKSYSGNCGRHFIKIYCRIIACIVTLLMFIEQYYFLLHIYIYADQHFALQKARDLPYKFCCMFLINMKLIMSSLTYKLNNLQL